MTRTTPATWDTIPVSTWSDTLDRLDLAGIMTGIHRVAGEGAFGGRAVTVRAEVAALGHYARDAFDVPAILQAIGDATVLVIDAGGAEVSCFGGLAARVAARRRAAGVIVDGGCRDIDEIRAAGVRVCSRHVTPVSGKGRVRVAEINGTITCGGVAVCAGDVIVADHTGIAVISASRFDQAAALARDIDARDRAFAEALERGEDFGRIATRLEHL